jgi:hypothetical protein
MDQPDSLIAEMRAHRLREQKKKLLLADAKNRRLRVAAILNEWARKTMAEFDPATAQRPSEEQEQHSALAAKESQPQGSREPDHGNTKALDENRAGA